MANREPLSVFNPPDRRPEAVVELVNDLDRGLDGVGVVDPEHPLASPLRRSRGAYSSVRTLLEERHIDLDRLTREVVLPPTPWPGAVAFEGRPRHPMLSGID